MSTVRSWFSGKVIDFLPAILIVIALCCALPQLAYAGEGESPLQAGEAPLATAPAVTTQAVSDLQFVGLSGASVTGSVASGYTIYVRDGDLVSVDLQMKNATSSSVDYIALTKAPSIGEGDDAWEPILFPRPRTNRIEPPVENTEYDAYRWYTSDTSGDAYTYSEYKGFDIQAGETATFTLNIGAGDLAPGTYDWNIQLGRIRSDYERRIVVVDETLSYWDTFFIKSETEEAYSAQIPLRVVVYNQANASIKAGVNTGTGFNPVLDPSAIDFGTIDLASTDESIFKDVRTITVMNDRSAHSTDKVANVTDRYGNPVSVKIGFGGESSRGGANYWGGTPFDLGNIYDGYTLKLYDDTWSPLEPAQDNTFSYAEYSVVLDAAYCIAGTYSGNILVYTTPHKLLVNGQMSDGTGVYRIPFSVTLTGTNPRLLPRPTDFAAIPGNGQVELTWTPAAGSSEYTEYTIFRREGAETQANPDELDWSLYEEIGTKIVGNNEELLYVDGDVENGVTYSYTVMCGSPNQGYAAAAVTARPDASIQSRMLAPISSVSGSLNCVELEWHMNDRYGGYESDGAGMVDHFNVYRDGVLVDVIYQSAVYDQIQMGWHDDGTGTDTQVYGPTSHNYSWSVKEPVPELYVTYSWTVSAVSPSGLESYLDEEGPAHAYGEAPIIVGHKAYYDDDFYDYGNEYFNDMYDGPAMMITLDAYDGVGSPEEFKVWRSEGTAAPDTTQPVCSTIGSDGSRFCDRGVEVGKTYTYTAQPMNVAGELGDFYTFTVKALTPSPDDYYHFDTPNVSWTIVNGTTARLKFSAPKNITASVFRNGTKLNYTPDDGYETWYFDVKDNPGSDGTYVYRVEYAYSGITTSREFTFVRNTQPVDTSELLKPPDAPTLSGRTAGDANVILSWTPAATGGTPEGYHIYRTDADRQIAKGRYLVGHSWNGDYDYYEQWGNARYISIAGGDTLTFVDGGSGYYKGDKHLGEITGLSWDDSNMPHTYYITAYNRAGESAPSELLVFDESAENEGGYPIAPPNPVDEAPAAPTIERAWVEWSDTSTYRYFAPWLNGYVHVAWSDPSLGADIDRWTATFAGTYLDEYNPPLTQSLGFAEALVDPAAKLGTSTKSPTCNLRAEFGDNGDYGRTIAVTVAAENAAGSSTSEEVSVDVVSAPLFYALPDNGGACLRWTDLSKDAVTQVTGWEIWRKPAYGLRERVATLPATIEHAGKQRDYNNVQVGYYEWLDSDLDNGWAYEYQVVAKCADGVDRPSVVREVTPEATAAVEAPGAPRNLTAQVVDGIVYLNWDKPATGGAVGYYCPQVLGPDIDWYLGTISNVNDKSTSTIWMPKKPGTYRLTIWAYCSIDGVDVPASKLPYQIDGYDDMTDDERLEALYPNHSNVVEVTITQEDIDSQPSGIAGDFSITLTPGDGQVAVSWTASENAISYEIERYDIAGYSMPAVKMVAVPGQQAYTYVDDTAEPGVRYRYVVSAIGARERGLSRDGYATTGGTTHDEQVAQHMEALIEALPAPDDVTVEDVEQVSGVQEVWESLTSKQKALVSDELAQKLADDVDAAEQLRLLAEYSELVAPVQALIDDLPDANDITADDAESVRAVRAAFEALVPAEAKKIVKTARLIAAEEKLAAIADQEAADAVAVLIEALPVPEDIQLGDKPAVEEARAALDALTEAQLGYLPEHCDDKLIACEERIAALEKLAADTAAAQEVTGIIGNLPGVDELQLDDRAAVEAARSAYEALSDEAKAMVGNYGDLVTAEAKLAALQKEVDEHAAAQVDDVIDRLPAPEALTLDDKPAVEAARAAYDALTDDQQGYVTKLADLEAAEARIADLAAEVQAEEDSREIIALIDQIGSDVSLESESAIAAARAAYDQASEKAREKVRQAGKLADLEAAEARLQQLKDEAAEAARIDIVEGVASLSPSSFVYDGKAKTPDAKLVVGGKTLTPGVDYSVSYARNVNAGTAQATLAGIGAYKGEKTVAFTIKKAPNTLVAKAKSKKLKASAKKLKKKNVKIKATKAFAIANPKGVVSFKKVKGHKKISVAPSGKITLKKKLKKGTYKVKVAITADGGGNYGAKTVTVAFKIKVK